MNTTSKCCLLLLFLCSLGAAKEVNPLSWSLERWQYVVVAQVPVKTESGEADRLDLKIVSVLRGGTNASLPQFDRSRLKGLAKGESYLMCFHKAPPGTSGWVAFRLKGAKGPHGWWRIPEIRRGDESPENQLRDGKGDMSLEEFNELLKEIPFDPIVERTQFFKNGMISKYVTLEAIPKPLERWQGNCFGLVDVETH